MRISQMYRVVGWESSRQTRYWSDGENERIEAPFWMGFSVGADVFVLVVVDIAGVELRAGAEIAFVGVM